MSSKEQPSKKEKDTPTQRMLKIGAGVLGVFFGLELVKGFFRHN